MKITVIGCGRWGSFLAYYTNMIGHEVTLWGRPDSAIFKNLYESRHNQYLSLQKAILITSDLECALYGADLALVAISVQEFRGFLADNSQVFSNGVPLLLCMKGLEVSSGKRLTQIVAEVIGVQVPTAVLAGPGHVQDLIGGQPGCMIVSGQSADIIKNVINSLSGGMIRLYIGEDLIGTEVGAAAKNVIGIAAGILDGLGVPVLKGALMTRGAFEIARLVRRMGGHEQTVYGLSHLGDYEATLFSQYSHNRAFGEALVKGERYSMLAEGVDTAEALQVLAASYEIDLPICTAVYQVLHGIMPPSEGLMSLLFRPGRFEFT